MKNTIATIFAVLVLGVSTQANAGLLGSTATSQLISGKNPLASDSFVVNGSVFQYGNVPTFSITVTDNKIEYDYLANITWGPGKAGGQTGFGLFMQNGNLLTFGGASAITSVALDPSSSVVAGFGSSNVTFSSTQVAVNWQNLTFRNGDRVVINVNPVPEPETYAMMLAGLGLLGFMARRKKSA